MQRRDFIKYCLGCSCLLFMSGGLYYTKHITPNTDENNADDKNSILHIEIHLTEHCNLKCKYCSHFSAIAKEEYYDVNKYKKDMKRLSKITGGKINVIQLLGGEPLLHPEINKLMNITRFYFPHTTIDIITNGLLLDKMPDSFWSNF